MTVGFDSGESKSGMGEGGLDVRGRGTFVGGRRA